MNIEQLRITVRELVSGFTNNEEEGVYCYDGLLNIRPPYQREFVYNEKQRDAVIDSVIRGYPLNVMYWAKKEDGHYELIDGQQRTMSLCLYAVGFFAVEMDDGDVRYIDSLLGDDKEKFLDYELTIYACSGSDKEILSWFKTINIAGERLTNQELRNAVYTGAWLTDAKKKFSKTNCVAYQLGAKYIKGSPIRQEYLETVLRWAADKDGTTIEGYMSAHQKDHNAGVLWQYFQSVVSWVGIIFQYRKEMKGISWGYLYNEYSGESYDAEELETKVKKLMADSDVTRKQGIYEYLLSHETKEAALSIRAFDSSTKREVYERQHGICPECEKIGRGTTVWNIDEMEADHIVPWSQGGRTVASNCQLLCKEHNRRKSDS